MKSASADKGSAALRIIGVGNRLRADDGVGPEIAALVRRMHIPGVAIFDEERDGLNILERLQGAEKVVLVDTVISGAAPGTIRRFDLSQEELPAWVNRHSTHLFGITDAVELARAFGVLPPTVILYGIEGTLFDFESAMSPAVADVLQNAAVTVAREFLPLPEPLPSHAVPEDSAASHP